MIKDYIVIWNIFCHVFLNRKRRTLLSAIRLIWMSLTVILSKHLPSLFNSGKEKSI